MMMALMTMTATRRAGGPHAPGEEGASGHVAEDLEEVGGEGLKVSIKTSNQNHSENTLEM